MMYINMFSLTVSLPKRKHFSVQHKRKKIQKMYYMAYPVKVLVMCISGHKIVILAKTFLSDLEKHKHVKTNKIMF